MNNVLCRDNIRRQEDRNESGRRSQASDCAHFDSRFSYKLTEQKYGEKGVDVPESTMICYAWK